MVDHPNIKFATSIIDYVFRVLGYEYLGRTDFLQVKPEELSLDVDQPTDGSTLEPQAPGPAEPQEPSPPASPPSNSNENSNHGGPTAQGDGDTGTSSNGKGGHVAPTNGSSLPKQASPAPTQTAVLDNQLSQMMGDAPFCDNCGHITVRNGSCYKCLNCGNSVGCS